jgi:predicted aldo/keto reductase-like oxidoreductase
MKGRPRDSFVISTKVLMDTEPRTGLFPADTDIDAFRKKFDESLKRLQLDYVDILYLHMMNNGKALGFKPITGAMLKLKKEGKVRFLGVSTHENEPEVIRSAVEHKIYDVVLTSYNFRQPHKEEIKKAIDEAAAAGLGVVAMKTQAGVFWDKERKQPINMKAALKWALQDKNVHTSIPGITSFDQLELDVSVMEDLALDAGEMADLKLCETTAGSGLFCPQCGKCRSQCRYNLDIPTLMRCYMYTYGYENPYQSKWILERKDASEITCRNCDVCAVSCTMGFDVPQKINDIIRVKDVPGEFLA